MLIPLGFRFAPTHEEVITYYLLPRAMDFSAPCNHHILEKPLYGENADPTHVFRDVDESHWVISEGNDRVIYVLTKLSKINNGKTRISRRAGCGTWSGQTGGKRIKNGSGELIGSMRMFSFEAAGKRDDHHWIMHEYSLAGIYSDRNCRGLKHKDYVICKIRRTSKRKGDLREDVDVVAPSFKKLKAATIGDHVTDPTLMSLDDCFAGSKGPSIQEYIPALTAADWPEECNNDPFVAVSKDSNSEVVVSANLADSVSDPKSIYLDDDHACPTGPDEDVSAVDRPENSNDHVVGAPSFKKLKAAIMSNYQEESNACPSIQEYVPFLTADRPEECWDRVAMISNYQEEEDCWRNLDDYLFACSTGPSIQEYIPVLTVDRPEESDGVSKGGNIQSLAGSVFDCHSLIISDDGNACPTVPVRPVESNDYVVGVSTDNNSKVVVSTLAGSVSDHDCACPTVPDVDVLAVDCPESSNNSKVIVSTLADSDFDPNLIGLEEPDFGLDDLEFNVDGLDLYMGTFYNLAGT